MIDRQGLKAIAEKYKDCLTVGYDLSKNVRTERAARRITISPRKPPTCCRRSSATLKRKKPNILFSAAVRTYSSPTTVTAAR